jgi:hypothetical protein
VHVGTAGGEQSKGGEQNEEPTHGLGTFPEAAIEGGTLPERRAGRRRWMFYIGIVVCAEREP